MLLLTLSDLLIFEKYENRLGDRIIKQLLNLVIAIMINNDLLATDKSQHFAQPHPKIVNYSLPFECNGTESKECTQGMCVKMAVGCRPKCWEYSRKISFYKILTFQALHQDTWMQCVSKRVQMHMSYSLLFCSLQNIQHCIFLVCQLV